MLFVVILVIHVEMISFAVRNMFNVVMHSLILPLKLYKKNH